MTEKQKLILVGLITGSITAFIIGLTFAYWTWQSTSAQQTLVSFTVGDGFSCSADGGGNITSTDVQLMPTECTDTAHAIKRTVKVNTQQNPNKTVYLDMNLKVNSIGSGLTNTENFRYSLTTEDTSCRDGIVESGNFVGATTDTELKLFDEERFLETSSNTYYLWIWLDKEETSQATQGQSFDLSLTGFCSDTDSPKAYVHFGYPGQYFKASQYANNITSVSIVNEINVPSGATSWELGVSPSKSSDVVGWLEEDTNNTGKYALKVGSNVPMFSNENLSLAFFQMSNLSSINLSGLNTRYANSMGLMFQNAGQNTSNFSLDLGNDFSTKNVTNMAAMFLYLGQNAKDFSVNLGSKFDTGNVVLPMSSMFVYAGYNATNFDLNLGNNFNASKTTNMTNMFYNIGWNSTNFNLNLGNNFNASNVINIDFMFRSIGSNASNFSLDLGNNFNASNVTDMSSMFDNVGINANVLNVYLGNNFNASNVVDMHYMFYHIGWNSTNFNLNLGNNFNASNVINIDFMFRSIGYTAFNFNLNLGNNFNVSNLTNMSHMFDSIGSNASNFSLDLGNNFNASNVTDMSSMFDSVGINANVLNIYLGNNFNSKNVTNMSHMFYYTGQKTTNLVINLGKNFDTSNVTRMAYMFDNVGLFTQDFSLDLGNKFNTSKVTTMDRMFRTVGANTVNFILNLGNQFYTDNVTDFYEMFHDTGRNATNFYFKMGNPLNISGEFGQMFQYFGNKTQNPFVLDLSGGSIPENVANRIFFDGFPSNYATIYVKDEISRERLIAGNGNWNTNFNANNVLIK